MKKIDGKVVNNITELLNSVSRLSPGLKTSALLNRKGKDIEVEIQIGKRSKPKNIP
jgi:S1-C subfamily serine protease